jgi:high-affinity iron transporter
VITFKLEQHLPYKKMLIVTGLMIALVLVVLVGNTARTLQGVGWLSITPIDVEFPLWTGTWLGVFPTVETLVAQGLSFAFVIGSYLVAEWWRKRRVRAALAQYRDEKLSPGEAAGERQNGAGAAQRGETPAERELTKAGARAPD